MSDEAGGVAGVPDPPPEFTVRIALATGLTFDWKGAVIGESNRVAVPEKKARRA